METLILTRWAVSLAMPILLHVMSNAPVWFCIALVFLTQYVGYEFSVLHRRIDHLERNGWLLTGNTSRRKKEG